MIPSARGDLGALGQLTRYNISLTIDMNGPALYGQQTVVLTNTDNAPLSELYFGLYPNAPFNFAQLEVGDVTVGGKSVTTALEEENTALRVSLPTPLPTYASTSVQMVFTTTVPVSPAGFETIAYDSNMLPLASWYPILLVHDSAGWHKQLAPEYGDLVYSQSAYYTVDVTSPADLVVVASGIPFGQPRVSGASKTQTFRTGPVRDFYIIASDAFCVISRQAGDTTVNSYYLAGKESYGQSVADVAAATIATLDKDAGTYPFQEFDVAESPVNAGGVEYPGLVVISNRYYRTPAPDLQFVVAHETSHQWWYSVVGDDQVTEPWLDEALADYSSALYWEDHYGSASAQSLVRSVFQQPYEAAVRAGNDMPVNLPVAAYANESSYSAIVYNKGALYFSNLRQAIGDDAFFRLLSVYFQTYKYGVAHSNDWRRLATQIGGPAAERVYETWVLGAQQ